MTGSWPGSWIPDMNWTYLAGFNAPCTACHTRYLIPSTLRITYLLLIQCSSILVWWTLSTVTRALRTGQLMCTIWLVILYIREQFSFHSVTHTYGPLCNSTCTTCVKCIPVEACVCIPVKLAHGYWYRYRYRARGPVWPYHMCSTSTGDPTSGTVSAWVTSNSQKGWAVTYVWLQVNR